ncbi:unnamed protein product, partial [Linum tenue]
EGKSCGKKEFQSASSFLPGLTTSCRRPRFNRRRCNFLTMDRVSQWYPDFMVEPGFVAKLRYEEAASMSEFTESLGLILLQENGDVE